MSIIRKKTLLLSIIVCVSFMCCVNNKSDKNNPPGNTYADSSTTSSTELDSLMMKIINKDIETPMDSSLAKKCFDYMEINFSLMNKILESSIAESEQGAQVAMANYLVCNNAIELLDKSKPVLNEYMKDKIKEYRNKLDSLSPTFYSLYLKSIK